MRTYGGLANSNEPLTCEPQLSKPTLQEFAKEAKLLFVNNPFSPNRLFRRGVVDFLRAGNRVLVLGILVFAAQIMLGAALSRVTLWMTDRAHASPLLLWLAGPFIVDGAKVICLLAAAYPLGRIWAGRPVSIALGMVSVVYALDFVLALLFGYAKVLWATVPAVAGRGALAIGTALLVVVLVRKGRQVAFRQDGGTPSEEVATDQADCKKNESPNVLESER